MDVQKFLDQERSVSQLQLREKTVREIRSQENLVRHQRERRRAAEMERQASWAASSPGAILRQALVPRPFDDLMWRMEEQSRCFQKFTDLTSSAIVGKTVSDAMKVGETCRRLMEPIPALKSVLAPFTVAPAFDKLRYVTPFAEFERQVSFLRDHSFTRFDDLRSKISDTILGLSRVIKATPYAESPLVPFAESDADFSLGDVVDLVGSTVELSPVPDWMEVTALLREIESRLSALESRDNLWVLLNVVSLLIGLLSLCLPFAQDKSLPPDQKQPACLQSPESSPPKGHEPNFAGPCP